ncbi:MAG: heme biosynthesis HemY N-terminal domain-containing protein [Dechloromonas sp.]|nr:heme biosynthesis HemY N-terminal domain-containing protein [Dechloromonas sp.]
MNGLFWILALFAAAVAVALGARLNDGYVLFVLAPWRLEISLNLLLLLSALAFLVFYFLLRTLAMTFALPRRVLDYRDRRQREKSVLIFQDAVRLLFEGRFGQALKRAGEAHARGTAPGLSALIAARAAQRLREPEKQQEWLARAMQDDTRNEAATLMLEAEMMTEERQFSQALAALERLQSSQGRHLAALRVELRARQGAGDWAGVLKVARQLLKRAALQPETAHEIVTKAHLALIASLADDQGKLIDYLKQLPKGERGRRVVLAAARALTAQGADDDAQKLIEAALDKADDDAWQPALLSIYGRLVAGDQMHRIAQAEKWLRQQPENAVLLLALGRMCLRQRLWGKAENYLQASLAVTETQAVHLELARLCDQLEKTDEANAHYRAAVRLDPLEK